MATKCDLSETLSLIIYVCYINSPSSRPGVEVYHANGTFGLRRSMLCRLSLRVQFPVFPHTSMLRCPSFPALGPFPGCCSQSHSDTFVMTVSPFRCSCCSSKAWPGPLDFGVQPCFYCDWVQGPKSETL